MNQLSNHQVPLHSQTPRHSTCENMREQYQWPEHQQRSCIMTCQPHAVDRHVHVHTCRMSMHMCVWFTSMSISKLSQNHIPPIPAWVVPLASALSPRISPVWQETCRTVADKRSAFLRPWRVWHSRISVSNPCLTLRNICSWCGCGLFLSSKLRDCNAQTNRYDVFGDSGQNRFFLMVRQEWRCICVESQSFSHRLANSLVWHRSVAPPHLLFAGLQVIWEFWPANNAHNTSTLKNTGEWK